MWYVFPQIKGLGYSSKSKLYALKSLQEAKDYLEVPILRQRLYEICSELLKHADKTAYAIFGSPDDRKLHSSMTLFALADEKENNIFLEVLQFFLTEKRL